MATLLVFQVTPAVGRPCLPAITTMARSQARSCSVNQRVMRKLVSRLTRKNVATIIELMPLSR